MITNLKGITKWKRKVVMFEDSIFIVEQRLLRCGVMDGDTSSYETK